MFKIAEQHVLPRDEALTRTLSSLSAEIDHLLTLGQTKSQEGSLLSQVSVFVGAVTSSAASMSQRLGFSSTPIDSFYSKHRAICDQLAGHQINSIIALFRDTNGYSLIDHLFMQERFDELEILFSHNEPVLIHVLQYLSHPNTTELAPIATISDEKKAYLLKLIKKCSSMQLSATLFDVASINYALENYIVYYEHHADAFGKTIVYDLLSAYKTHRCIDQINRQLAKNFDAMIIEYLASEKQRRKDTSMNLLDKLRQGLSSEDIFTRLPPEPDQYLGHPLAQCIEIGDPYVFMLLLDAGINIRDHNKALVEQRLGLFQSKAHARMKAIASGYAGSTLKFSEREISIQEGISQISPAISDKKQLLVLQYLIFQMTQPDISRSELTRYLTLLSYQPIVERPDLLTSIISSSTCPLLIPNEETRLTEWVPVEQMTLLIDKATELVSQMQTELERIEPDSPEEESISGLEEALLFLREGLSLHTQKDTHIASGVADALASAAKDPVSPRPDSSTTSGTHHGGTAEEPGASKKEARP